MHQLKSPFRRQGSAMRSWLLITHRAAVILNLSLQQRVLASDNLQLPAVKPVKVYGLEKLVIFQARLLPKYVLHLV